MKIAIQQEILVEALKRGALAALSEEAQADTSPLALLIQAVSIKADAKNLTIKSASKLITTRYCIPIDASMDVREEGEILVPAKELFDWCGKQQACKLALSLTKLDTPEIINPMAAGAEGADVKCIKKIGTVKIVSKDESKTGAKWSLDCYEGNQMKESEINIPTVKQFSIPTKQLNEGINNISFASLTKHYQHIYDSVSFQKLNGKLYMVTCDTSRASLYEAADGKDIVLDTGLLVNVKMLSAIAKLTNETEDVSFYFDGDANKIYITQGDTLAVKLATADKGLISKFPPVGLLVDKKYVPISEASKGLLMHRLITTSIVNQMAAFFKFSNNQLVIQANSVSGKSPSSCDLPVKNLNFDLEAVWGVSHILDFLRILKDDNVELLINEKYEESWSKRSLKLTSKQDPNWAYFIMPQDPSKSKQESKED